MNGKNRAQRLYLAGAFTVLGGGLANAQTSFDVATLYSGVATIFYAAAVIAGGFLAIKFGAKMVKKAWAWLT